ncbi:MAG: hypothetical protein HF973_13735 [Chloroflexi bacterium]|nr:hypothetical protein [Chloroflexota bacterium]
MANKAKESLEKRAKKAIFKEAITRPESAAAIALTLILTTLSALNISVFGSVPAPLWLLGGAILESIIVYSSVTDPKFGQEAVAKLLRSEYEPERLRDKRLQQQINEALDYRRRIERTLREEGDSIIMLEFREAADQIDEWLGHMYDLALHIDKYQQERDVLERDRKRAESRLKQLQREYKTSDNPAVKKQVQLTTESVQRQLDTLDKLDDTIHRARLQLENSLVHLGTIYSQTMLVDAKDIDKSRARRLRQEIAEEVTEIGDLLSAMDEVYAADSAA